MIWRLCFYKRIGALITHAYVHKRMLPRVICLVQALVWMGQRQLRETSENNLAGPDQAGQEGVMVMPNRQTHSLCSTTAAEDTCPAAPAHTPHVHIFHATLCGGPRPPAQSPRARRQDVSPPTFKHDNGFSPTSRNDFTSAPQSHPHAVCHREADSGAGLWPRLTPHHVRQQVHADSVLLPLLHLPGLRPVHRQ